MARRTYGLLRLTLKSNRKEKSVEVREEAQVGYVRGPGGILVPATVTHHQFRNGSLAAENRFVYTQFRKFGKP